MRPVVVDPVDHGISDGDEPRLLQLLTQIVDVIGLNTVFGIHIGFMGEDIQRAGGIQLHGQCQIPCFLLRLFQQLFPQGGLDRGQLQRFFKILMQIGVGVQRLDMVAGIL